MTLKNLLLLFCILSLTSCFGPSEEEKAFHNLRETISLSSDEMAERNRETKEEILRMIEEENDTTTPDQKFH